MKKTYQNFLRRYAENKPYEDIAVEKAVKYFSESRQKPFQVSKAQDGVNYKTVLYDAELTCGDETVRVEVKTDHRSAETGNFYIEHHQYEKASGILTTQADYYIINDTVDYFLISVDDLIEMIEYYAERKVLLRRNFPNRDGLWTEGYLIKKQLALEHATKLL